MAARGYRAARRRWSNRFSVSESPLSSPHLALHFPAIPEFTHPSARGSALVDSLEGGELTLLNQLEPVARETVDWRLGPCSTKRLWTITLHYHQWLFELAKLCVGPVPLAKRAYPLFERLLADWLKNCDISQPGADSLAWNSYAIATRLAWSIRAHETLRGSGVTMPSPLTGTWLNSLWRQAAHLHANLEWDLRANHLLRDAVGLAWAGRFFAGPEADLWMRTATKLAIAQADEQLLNDGGQFERSPYYHLEVMDDWLSLALLVRDNRASQKMRATWQRAAEYARWLRHPDGRIVQLNDGAAALVDQYSSYGDSISQGVNVEPPSGGRWFKDSGVVAWHGAPWTIFWDVGEIGPDCQPGHAHADTLTIEASYHGRRLFVDPGCHSYDNDARREYDRSTIAHNTVCIDEQDSSEVWHIFRVGRRARPKNVAVAIRRDGFEAAASHTGYQHLSGRPRHERKVSVDGETMFAITDTITGAGNHMVEGGFLVHPAWDVLENEDGWDLRCDDQRLRVSVYGSNPVVLTTEVKPIHPDYGIESFAKRLTWRFEGILPLKVHLRVGPADRLAEITPHHEMRSLRGT